MNSVAYGVATIPLSNSDTANVLAALEIPHTDYKFIDEKVEHILDEVVCMYHHLCNEPLETLGTDYLFILYIPYRKGLNPRETLYVLRDTDSINTIQCS
jgi:hypothetical protein